MVLLLDVDRSGTPHRFTDADAFLLLEILSKNHGMSRKELSRYLGLGEGSVRTLIEKLKEFDLICVKQTGITIRPQGSEILRSLGIRSTDLSVGEYVMGEHQFGAVISDSSEKVFNGIDQRNIVIRTGGEGCTTWANREGRIVMLPDWDVDTHEPSLSRTIREHAKMGEGDVLIVAGGDTERIAMISAITAALDLI